MIRAPGDARPAAAPGVVALDAALWASFANARTAQARRTAWLALLVARAPDAVAGALFEPDAAAAAFTPRAVVPDPRRDLSAFEGVAARVAETGRPAVEPDAEAGRTRLACPATGERGETLAVVALELRGTDPAAAQAALREAHWAVGWLIAAAAQSRGVEQDRRLARAAVAMDALALAHEHARPEPAAMAVATLLQGALGCDQVAVGFAEGRRGAARVRLAALSHSAWFRKRSALVERLETAMEEALDQGSAVLWPPVEGGPRGVAVAHREHVTQGRGGAALSVPLPDARGPVGVLTAERAGERGFDPADVLLLEAVAGLVAPALAAKRRARRWLAGRIVDAVLHALGVVLGPRRLSWKLLALAIAALATAAATVERPFMVQADAALRGAVQRAATAPFAGFIDQAPLRAGDRVEAGQEIARLDDADLRLETLRWRSEIDRLTSQQRDAMSRYERAQTAFLEAQIGQARAQLALAEAELDRTRILAPIAGVIVSGDLTQKLGAPVEAGEVLFELAPLDGYRVDVFVDERDLRFVAEGAAGRLALTGRPDSALPVTVERVTPVAELREGVNVFRVEARLDAGAEPEGLRPGMAGVAKIEAGEALLVWIWTRRAIDWARRTLWTWQP